MGSENKPKLKDIATVIQGQSPKSKFYSESEGVPFLQGNRTFGNLYPTIDTYTTKVTKLAKKGEVLMSVRAPVGALNYASHDLCIGRGLASIKAKCGNHEFVYYALKYNIQNLIKQGAATTFDSVSRSTIENFELIIPKNEKDWVLVTSVLSKIDQKIELNNKINTELEAIAKDLYDYWFVQFDFPDENGRPYKSSGGKMVWSEELKRKIPKGWVVDSLGNHLRFTRGISYTSKQIDDETGFPMVNLNSFYLDGRYKHEGLKYYRKEVKKERSVFPGDLMIAVTDVTRNADIIGKSFILPDIFDGKSVTFSMDTARVTSDSLSKYYLNLFFNSESYHNYIKYFATGTLVLHLNLDGINWLKSFIPPSSLLDRFDKILDSINSQVTKNIKENIKLESLRDWLLPMLMNGQIKIDT